MKNKIVNGVLAASFLASASASEQGAHEITVCYDDQCETWCKTKGQCNDVLNQIETAKVATAFTSEYFRSINLDDQKLISSTICLDDQCFEYSASDLAALKKVKPGGRQVSGWKVASIVQQVSDSLGAIGEALGNGLNAALAMTNLGSLQAVNVELVFDSGSYDLNYNLNTGHTVVNGPDFKFTFEPKRGATNPGVPTDMH